MTTTAKNTTENHTNNDYLIIEGVYKSFGDFEILKDINLICERGELICLLGPSGCGKTTLLRIIAGLENQDAGRLTQDDKNITNLAVQQRDFGIVFQSYALFPNLTVEKNIAYGLGKSPNKDKRTSDLMKMVDLQEHAKKYPAQISGGQQQRVALARALAIEPNLLLLDEPLSALDAKVREHLRQEIKELQQRLGVTTLMVTHDQEEAMSMADKIVVMNAGRIEQVGSPHEVYTYPATPFVANFVGSMNFIPAKVIHHSATDTVSNSASDVTTEDIGKQNEKTNSIVHCLGLELVCDVKNKGDMVNIGVRPEHIVLSTELDIDNSVKVNINKIEFLGAFVRLYTEHTSTQEILVDIHNEQFITERLITNMQVSLQFKEQHIRVYAIEDTLTEQGVS